ncbi:MAG: TRAP transporter small permease [Xanthobacteraceae bacterium]
MPEPHLTLDDAPHRIDVPVAGASAIDNISEIVCNICLIAMIVLISMEAIARNVFHTSLQITDEVGGYLLVAMTFLSMSVAEAHGAFHRVELVQMRLNRKAQLVTQAIFDLMSLAASAAVTWQLIRLTMNSWRAEDVAATPLQTPLWLPQSTMAIGMALLCLALIRSILVKLARLRTGVAT